MIPKDQKVKITALRTKYGVTFYGRHTSTLDLRLLQKIKIN